MEVVYATVGGMACKTKTYVPMKIIFATMSKGQNKNVPVNGDQLRHLQLPNPNGLVAVAQENAAVNTKHNPTPFWLTYHCKQRFFFLHLSKRCGMFAAMSKETFTIEGSKKILELIEAAGNQAGFSRGQAFEDFLVFIRCALAGGTMEEEYLTTVEKGYQLGHNGERGIDYVVKGFGELINVMERSGEDVLGDIFTGAVTYGEAGQFFTPTSLTDLMADLVVGDAQNNESKSVNDPACGSGRFLLSIAKKHPQWTFTGQDIDHRCTQMTAINLGLRNLFGWAVWEDTLRLEVHRVYRTGLNLAGGVIQEVPVEQSPFYIAKENPKPQKTKNNPSISPSNLPPLQDGLSQLDLFPE